MRRSSSFLTGLISVSLRTVLNCFCVCLSCCRYGVESVDHLLATVEAHTFDLKEPDCIGFSQAQMYSISFQGDTSRGGLSIPLRSESEDKPAYTSALFKEHIFSGRCVSVVSQALQTAPDIQWDIVPPQIHLQNAVVHVPAIARTLQYFYQGNLEQPEFCFILQLEILRALVLCRQFRALNTVRTQIMVHN